MNKMQHLPEALHGWRVEIVEKCQGIVTLARSFNVYDKSELRKLEN